MPNKMTQHEVDVTDRVHRIYEVAVSSSLDAGDCLACLALAHVRLLSNLGKRPDAGYLKMMQSAYDH